MAAKKKPANKGEKKPTENKAKTPVTKSVDWSSVSDPCVIIGTGEKLKKGKEYPTAKANAMLIVNKGWATLK